MEAEGLLTLSPRLEEVLGGLPDREYAAKLRQVYLAAATAIQRLSDIDLVKYESAAVESSPDLALWEEMAPVIRDTVVDVNALLMVIREHFPAHPPGGLGDVLARVAEEAGKPVDAHRAGQAEEALQAACNALAQQVTQLGERMRSPQVVSDRWNLLADLQAFRSRFREEIGTMVYDTASAFVEVHRKDVVPFYDEEVAAAVGVRAAVADLIRVLQARRASVDEAELEDVQWNVQQLQKELDAFGRTAAYRAMRAQDKRVLVEFRQTLNEHGQRPHLAQKELKALVEPFVQFVESLAQVNQREIFLWHDREVSAACGVMIERALQQAASDLKLACATFSQAITRAHGLYGRENELDAYLRRAKKNPPVSLGREQLQSELQRFTELLAALALH
ncbi:MAG: hypothetical protein ACOZIN_06905 [Myxococcota bacterium]